MSLKMPPWMWLIALVPGGGSGVTRSIPYVAGGGVTRNIPYVAGGGAQQQLDLSLPAKPSGTLVVFVHGGSLSAGDKADSDYGKVCDPLVAAGLECANINYRLFPSVKWPAPAEDVAAAVAWLRRNISSYGGRADRIFLFGHSSGCLLVSLLGTDSVYLGRAGLKLTDISGVIAMGCRLNDVIEVPAGTTPEKLAAHFANDQYDAAFGSIAALNDAVPTVHVNKSMPPFLVLIAEAEQEQPPILADAKVFIAKANSMRCSASFQIMKPATHMSAIRTLSASPPGPGLQPILTFTREKGTR